MSDWGILTLGAIAAHTTGFILARVRPAGGMILLLALSPVYCSAALVFFHPAFGGNAATELYPAGLLLSFGWQQAWPLIERNQTEFIIRWMPAAIFSLLILLTVTLVLYAFLATHL